MYRAGKDGEPINQTQSLELQVRVMEFWATPTSHERTHDPRDVDRGDELLLEGQAATWATPATRDGKGGALEKTKQGRDLSTDATLWSSPRATDGEKGAVSQSETTRRSPAAGQANLAEMVQETGQWATPASRDHKGGVTDWQERTRDGQPRRLSDMTLADQTESPSSRPVLLTPDGQELLPPAPGSRRRLSPAFVCWLMGLPCFWTNPGWTSCAPGEMESFLCKQRSRLWCLLGERE